MPPKPRRKTPRPLRSPHDEFFKSTFSKLVSARDLLQGILPAELVRELALEELTQESDVFVSEVLRESRTDILFTCSLKNSQVLVAILLEHKSSQPSNPHLQILRYMLNIWERNLAAKQPLQVVIPIVLHNGATPWRHAPFSSFFPDLPEILKPFIPEIPILLEDLAQTPESELNANFHDPVGRLALGLMKFIYSTDDLDRLLNDFDPARSGREPEEIQRFLRSALVYILKSGETIELETFIENLQPNIKGVTMTIAETLHKKGLEEGLEKGREEGRVEGIEEGIHQQAVESAKKMLAEGLSFDLIAKFTKLSPEEISRLR